MAAITKKWVLMVRTNRLEMPKIMYFPNTGMAAIQTAAKSRRR